MNLKDVEHRADIEIIVEKFYEQVLADPIIGFIFVDIVKIDLASHLPLIVNFWSDVLFHKPLPDKKDGSKTLYKGNVLNKHLQVNSLVALKPGHFTRWLYLFNQVIKQRFLGKNSELMMARAELIAQSISAAITNQKKSAMNLVLPKD